MTTITVPNSREAIMALKPEIIGKKLTIRNLFAGQNLLVEKRPGGWHIPRLLKTDCYKCLTESGYMSFRDNAFIQRGSKPRLPVNLDQCKAALAGKTSTLLLELEGGATITLALAEGCRGGFGRPQRGMGVVSTGGEEGDWVAFGDSWVVPATMRSKPSAHKTVLGLDSTQEFWYGTGMGLPETPVADVRYVDGNDTGEWEERGPMAASARYVKRASGDSGDEVMRQLEFFFANERGGMPILSTVPPTRGIELILRLGRPPAEPLLWVELSNGSGTTRYDIDCGFKPLLLSKDGMPQDKTRENQ